MIGGVKSLKDRAWLLGLALLLLPRMTAAGDLADVKARGKLIMIGFANQDNAFVRINLDALREQGRKLEEVRDPNLFEGMDIELIKGFAKSLGVGLEIHSLTTGYDTLIPALLRREGDFIANSLTITPQRLEKVDFSEPYFEGWEVVVVRPDSTIASPADLAGKKCAVARGSSQIPSLKSLAPEVEMLVMDFPFETYVAVEDGRADCTLSENATPVGETLSRPYPPLKVAFRVRKYEYGVALRKGSDLLGPLNTYLAGLKRTGELERIVERLDIKGLGRAPAPLQP